MWDGFERRKTLSRDGHIYMYMYMVSNHVLNPSKLYTLFVSARLSHPFKSLVCSGLNVIALLTGRQGCL